MKVKIKKYWKVVFYHNTNENKFFEMIVYAKNIQKVVEEFYKKINGDDIGIYNDSNSFAKLYCTCE